MLVGGRPGRVALRRDLVLPGFNHRAQERQSVGERAQFAERNRVVGTGDIVEVGAERIIPLPSLDLRRGHRRERLQRPEPGVRRYAGDQITRRVGETGENAWGQGASDGFRHRSFPWGSRSRSVSQRAMAGEWWVRGFRIPLGIGAYLRARLAYPAERAMRISMALATIIVS